MIHTVMVDTVLGHTTTYLIGFRLYFIGGISHSNTGSNSMEHFQIILSVTESDGLPGRETEKCQNMADGSTLSPVLGITSTARSQETAIFTRSALRIIALYSSLRLPA